MIKSKYLLVNFMKQGVVISGIVTYIQLWCMEAKGPVFVTLFNPLSTLLVALLSYFVLGEKLYIGRYSNSMFYTTLMWRETFDIIYIVSNNLPWFFSIIGGVIVVIGLYLLLWGKEHDEPETTTLKETDDSKAQTLTPDENNSKGEP